MVVLQRAVQLAYWSWWKSIQGWFKSSRLWSLYVTNDLLPHFLYMFVGDLPFCLNTKFKNFPHAFVRMARITMKSKYDFARTKMGPTSRRQWKTTQRLVSCSAKSKVDSQLDFITNPVYLWNLECQNSNLSDNISNFRHKLNGFNWINLSFIGSVTHYDP